VKSPAVANLQKVMGDAMTEFELKNIAREDIEDLLVKVEASFDIKFVGGELVHVRTFGQLCDHIANKIERDNSDDCTSQQAFYKLRDAICSTFVIENKSITTDFPLAVFLPRKSRRSRIKKLETLLDFKLNILRPPYWVSITSTILLLASVVELFFSWRIGLLGLTISIACSWFANKFGNELDLQTVGQLAEKMTKENYLKSRPEPKTFNKKEIEKVLTDWFSNYLDINKRKLAKDARIV